MLSLPGTAEPWEKAALYARVTGYLRAVNVDIGDRVRRRAEIARIVVPEMRPELRRAQARLTQERAELELARLTNRRLRDLRGANPEAIPAQEVDVARAQENIEGAQVALAEADRDRLRTLARYARIRAPFDGVIVRRILDPGALAREGTAARAEPVVEIARTDKLRVAFEVPESLAPSVTVGAEVTLQFDAFPGQDVVGTVARVSTALDAATRSMRAEIDLPNEDSRYGPGMYVTVRLTAPSIEGALHVPSRAVRGEGSERYGLVARDGFLHRVPVVVASDDGQRALVVRGLSAEDQIMVAGSPLARDGTRCETVLENP